MELNPSHPVTSGLQDQWHKLLAIHMRKQGLKEITITQNDIEEVVALPTMPVVVAHEKKDGIHILYFTSEPEALGYVAANQKRG
jgi:hypothetical protein